MKKLVLVSLAAALLLVALAQTVSGGLAAALPAARAEAAALGWPHGGVKAHSFSTSWLSQRSCTTFFPGEEAAGEVTIEIQRSLPFLPWTLERASRGSGAKQACSPF